MRERKTAIIGTGLAGLAIGYELLSQLEGHRGESIDFFSNDPGASPIAAGLLHLFHGPEARLPPKAREGLESSLDLLEKMQLRTPLTLIQAKKLIRPAKNEKQRSLFKQRAEQYPEELSYGDFTFANDTFSEALLIDQSWVIDTKVYLETLESALEEQGAHFFKEEAVTRERLEGYERVIIAAGHHSLELMQQLTNETISPIPHLMTKGQLAICPLRVEENSRLEEISINARAYLLKLAGRQELILGATFERTFSSEEPQESAERNQLLLDASNISPSLNLFPSHWLSGIRLAGPRHLPFIGSYRPIEIAKEPRQLYDERLSNKQLSDKPFSDKRLFERKLFVLTGLGSKGLLYHRWMAQKLIHEILNPSLINRSSMREKSGWLIHPLHDFL